MSIGTIRIISALLLITILLPFASVDVQADERAGKACEPGAFDRSDHFLSHLLAYQQDLGLTEEQAGKLRTIHQALKKDQIKGEADRRLIQVDLFPLLHDEKVELAAIETKFKQMESLRTAAHVTAVKATRDAQAVLTAEQRGKIQTLLMQERQRSGQRPEDALPEGKERN